MTDKGYEVTTHEKQAEFDKKRNYTYGKEWPKKHKAKEIKCSPIRSK
jgi:hypothetical protein